jgi:hypothetical protein
MAIVEVLETHMNGSAEKIKQRYVTWITISRQPCSLLPSLTKPWTLPEASTLLVEQKRNCQARYRHKFVDCAILLRGSCRVIS